MLKKVIEGVRKIEKEKNIARSIWLSGEKGAKDPDKQTYRKILNCGAIFF